MKMTRSILDSLIRRAAADVYLKACTSMGLALLLSGGSVQAADKVFRSTALAEWDAAGAWGEPPTGTTATTTPEDADNVFFNSAATLGILTTDASETVANWTYNRNGSHTVASTKPSDTVLLTITGTLTKDGTGTQTFRSSQNTGTKLAVSAGQVVINAGSLIFGTVEDADHWLTSLTMGAATMTGSSLMEFRVGATSGTTTITGALGMSGTSTVSVRLADGAGTSGTLSVGSLTSTSANTIIRANNGSTAASTVAGTLILNNAAGNSTYAGIIQNGGSAANTNTMSVSKEGAGSQTFSGLNTYTGTTTVSQGRLQVNGTHAGADGSPAGTGAGNYLVAGNATLGGTGSITGSRSASITLQAGSFLMVGNTHSAGSERDTAAQGLSILSGAGGYNMSSDAILQFDIFSSIAGANNTPDENDILLLGSTVTAPAFAGKIQLALGEGAITSGWAVNDEWKLIDWTGLTPGTNNLTLQTSELNGFTLLGESRSDGYYVVATAAVPEPSKIVLLLAGVFWVGLRRRRRDSGV